MKGFTFTWKKYSSENEYFMDKYPDLFLDDEKVYKLIKNKNYRNNQNYVINNDISFNYTKLIKNYFYYIFNKKYNSKNIGFFDRLFGRKKTKVFYHNIINKKYLLIEKNFFNKLSLK